MPAKVVTLSVKDQDLLRVALCRAIEWQAIIEHRYCATQEETAITARIKELKGRIV